MDTVMGKAILFRSIGILMFVQARTETNQWAVCQIPVAVEGGHKWETLTPWRAAVEGGTEVLHVEPSVLDYSGKFTDPNWHNAASWQTAFVEGDQLPAYELEDVGYDEYCRRINAEAFQGWQFLS